MTMLRRKELSTSSAALYQSTFPITRERCVSTERRLLFNPLQRDCGQVAVRNDRLGPKPRPERPRPALAATDHMVLITSGPHLFAWKLA